MADSPMSTRLLERKQERKKKHGRVAPSLHHCDGTVTLGEDHYKANQKKSHPTGEQPF
jgi:hypothetical protein